MTCCIENGITYKQEYNTENRISSIMKLTEGTCAHVIKISTKWDFTYDGDGKRVKSVMQTNYTLSTTYFVGNYYEMTDGIVTKYYYAGTQRIAMRKNGTLNFIIDDHLGSTSLVTDASGNVVSQQQYKAWGETRYSTGTEQTKYTYTGQYSYTSDFGLHFYNARWYDSSLSRFAQADTIIPASQGVQGYDRYAYVSNNPLRYTDITGRCPICLPVIGAALGSMGGAAIGAGTYVLTTALSGREFNVNDYCVNRSIRTP